MKVGEVRYLSIVKQVRNSAGLYWMCSSERVEKTDRRNPWYQTNQGHHCSTHKSSAFKYVSVYCRSLVIKQSEDLDSSR